MHYLSCLGLTSMFRNLEMDALHNNWFHLISNDKTLLLKTTSCIFFNHKITVEMACILWPNDWHIIPNQAHYDGVELA